MNEPTAAGFRQTGGLQDWRSVAAGARAWFAAPSHAAGAGLVARIAGLPAIAGRNGLPDIDLRADGVGVRLGPGDAALARAISAAADGLGLTGEPAALQALQVRIDAAWPEPVTSFWRTVLGYERAGHGMLADPLRRAPAVRVGRLSEPRPLRNRIHLDVVRGPEAVRAIKTALGGEAYGANGLTLADSEGNEADLVPGSELSPQAPDWRALFAAMTFYPAASPRQAARLAAAVAGLADDAGVPLLIDLRPDGVVIDSGKDQWEDGRDSPGARFAGLAGRIQSAARDLGLPADGPGRAGPAPPAQPHPVRSVHPPRPGAGPPRHRGNRGRADPGRGTGKVCPRRPRGQRGRHHRNPVAAYGQEHQATAQCPGGDHRFSD